jgi:hypothetical protein
MTARSSAGDVLKKNRYVYIAVLLIPVFAVLVALVLISFLGHSKLGLIYIVLTLVMIQYLGLVAYIWRRLSA